MLILQGRETSKMIEKPITKCDSASQTDTHILEPNIVKTYAWNEWELRRKAIKLVRIISWFIFYRLPCFPLSS